MIKNLWKLRCFIYRRYNDGNRDLLFPEIADEWISFFDTHFREKKFPNTSENVLIIVETREDDRLSFAIKNVTYYIPDWELHIFHSKENESFIKNILGEQENNITLHQLENPINSPKDYNNLLLSFDFWESLSKYKSALIFQSDSFMLRSGIERFTKYDYIGAPWKWWKKVFKNTKRMGGNGGFSLRNITKMKEVISKHQGSKPPAIPDYHNEDVFFSYHLYHDKEAVLPSFREAMLFASETFLCRKSMAAHQAWRFFTRFKPRFKIRKV